MCVLLLSFLAIGVLSDYGCCGIWRSDEFYGDNHGVLCSLYTDDLSCRLGYDTYSVYGGLECVDTVLLYAAWGLFHPHADCVLL